MITNTSKINDNILYTWSERKCKIFIWLLKAFFLCHSLSELYSHFSIWSASNLTDSYLICSCILVSSSYTVLPTNAEAGRNIKYIYYIFTLWSTVLMFLKELKGFDLLDTIACQIGAVILKSV